MADYEPKDTECYMCGRENVVFAAIKPCNHPFCYTCLKDLCAYNKKKTKEKPSVPISKCPKCRIYFTMNNVVKLKMGSTNFYPIDLTYDTDYADEFCNICKPIDLTGKKRRFPNFEKFALTKRLNKKMKMNKLYKFFY